MTHSTKAFAGPVLLAAVAILAAAIELRAQQPPAGGPWKRHAIDASSRGADGTRLADVNGDKLLDIVTGWEQGGVTRAYLNPGAAKARAKWPAVTVGRTPSVEDAVFVDLDGDGATDVVSCCEGRTRSMFVHWAPKQKSRYLDPKAWKTESIPVTQDEMAWMFCAAAQLDGRHGVDLIAAGKARGAKVGWLEAPKEPRNLHAWKFHPLISASWIMSLVMIDMDGDGDLDILVSERRGERPGCYWLDNPAPGPRQRESWPLHRIGPTDQQVMFLCVADLDADGLKDVLVAQKPREILFHRRKTRDGRQWGSYPIPIPDSAGTAKAVNVGDIDLDGKLDVVFTCEGAGRGMSGVMWLSCRGKPADGAWRAHDVSGPEGVKYDLVQLIDMDGDGDLDALTCEESANLGVIWYENPTRPQDRQTGR